MTIEQLIAAIRRGSYTYKEPLSTSSRDEISEFSYDLTPQEAKKLILEWLEGNT